MFKLKHKKNKSKFKNKKLNKFNCKNRQNIFKN